MYKNNLGMPPKKSSSLNGRAIKRGEGGKGLAIKEKRKQSVWTIAFCPNEFAHRLFCESKIPRSLITQQEFFGK